MGIQSYYNEIKNKFDQLIKRENLSSSLAGLQLGLIGIIQIFIAVSFFELLGHFSVTLRTILFLVLAIISLGLISYFFLVPVFKYFRIFYKVDYQAAAKKVGSSFPFIKDDLLNAYQLVSINNKYFSEQLSEAAFKHIYHKTEKINFSEAVDFEKTKRLLKISLSVLFVAAILFFTVPGLMAASNRIINFNKEYIEPAKFSFNVKPGDKQISRGDNLVISAQIIGPVPSNVNIAIKYIEQTEYEFKELLADSSGNYNFEIPQIRSSFDYFIKAEEVHSNNYKISVINKPVIRNLKVIVTPPSYSKLPVIEQKDNGNITSLIGSQVQFELTSSKENLNSAKLLLNDSSEIPLNISNRSAAGKMRIKKDINYQILLTDDEGNTNENPVTYSIKTMVDEYPSINIVLPNKDISLGEDDRLLLLSKVSDDYGFSKLLLYYRLSASRYEKPHDKYSSLELPVNKNRKEEDINYIWNLSPLHLATEDVVTYYLEIFDNDFISGPKSAKTAAFSIRVPSLDEILSKADEINESSEKKLTETLAEAQKLKEEMEKINQDLKKDKREITWQEKERIEKALQKFDEIEKNVEDISKDLSQMQNELQQNNLLSKETLEKYMELQELFDQLSNDEMKKAMEKMQDLLKTLDRNQIQKAMENMQINEEQIQKSIERTMNLLKRIQIEQKMDELIKRTEKLNEKIENTSSKTEKSDLNKENQKEDLAGQQKEVSDELKSLEEKLKDLQEKMNEFKDMPQDQMEKLMEEYEKQQNEEMSKQAEQQLMKGQKMQAQQNQQQLSQNMKKMQQQMSELQQQMQMENQRQVFSNMMKALENMITLSKEQEKVKNQSQKLEPNSPAFNESAKKQNSIQQGMDKILSQLNELSQKTFAITPEMGKALGKARMNMQQSISALQNRNGAQASNFQGQAMSALNEAATLMKGSMESMMNPGGSGGGMMSLMQQLQQLSQQQMQLNNLTQALNDGELSMQQQAQLQRLAQEQEIIQKSLEQLNEESKISGESKKLPANLDKVLQEMHEVVIDMKTEKLDDDLVQKQERILSKLLDAQRSINERDFEKNRESNTGENLVRESPAELNLSSQKGKNKIKDELIRAVQEGFAKDYEDLIRKYYEALQKENLRN